MKRKRVTEELVRLGSLGGLKFSPVNLVIEIGYKDDPNSLGV